MKFLFIVQGEGRGHLSQALALEKILISAGHEICCIMTGKSPYRELPDYFHKNIHSKQYSFQSPNFKRTLHNRGILVFISILINLSKCLIYFKSILFIVKKISLYKPDVVINLYEPLTGIAYKFFKIESVHIAIAHHFIIEHQDFPLPDKKYINKKMLFWLNRITSCKAKKILALSFKPMVPFHNNNKIIVTPPLIREEIFRIIPKTDDFIMGYMLNYGFFNRIVAWHNQHKDIKAVFFWDRPDVPDELIIDDNLIFYKADDQKFITLLSSCKGFISTAGFESICEAIFFKKPFVTVPINNHFEQLCNALDAHNTGKGIYSDIYDPNKLISLLSLEKNETSVAYDYHPWFLSAPEFFIKHLTYI